MTMRKRNIFIYGKGGTGKTTSILTLLKEEQLKKTPNIQLRFFCLENNAVLGIEEALDIHKIKPKPGQLVYMEVQPDTEKTANFAQRSIDWKENFTKVQTSEVQKISPSAKGKGHYSLFQNTLDSLAKYKGIDWATKEVVEEGDVSKWDSNKILVIDSFTSLVDNAVSEVQGERVIPTQQDYGIVGNAVMNQIVIPTTNQYKCSAIFLGHTAPIEREDVRQPTAAERKAGAIPEMVMGAKGYGHVLSRSLPEKFNVFTYAYLDKEGKYKWKGKQEGRDNMMLSIRLFPRESNLEQDFSMYNVFVED